MAGNYRLIYSSGTPVQIDIYNNPARPKNDSHHNDVWFKDNWVIARRLTLNIGGVFARDNGFIPAQCREAGTDLFSACAALIDRTCACVSLILETAAQMGAGEHKSA